MHRLYIYLFVVTLWCPGQLMSVPDKTLGRHDFLFVETVANTLHIRLLLFTNTEQEPHQAGYILDPPLYGLGEETTWYKRFCMVPSQAYPLSLLQLDFHSRVIWVYHSYYARTIEREWVFHVPREVGFPMIFLHISIPIKEKSNDEYPYSPLMGSNSYNRLKVSYALIEVNTQLHFTATYIQSTIYTQIPTVESSELNPKVSVIIQEIEKKWKKKFFYTTNLASVNTERNVRKKQISNECEDLDCKRPKNCHKRNPKRCRMYDLGKCIYKSECAYKHQKLFKNKKKLIKIMNNIRKSWRSWRMCYMQ